MPQRPRRRLEELAETLQALELLESDESGSKAESGIFGELYHLHLGSEKKSVCTYVVKVLVIVSQQSEVLIRLVFCTLF